LDAVNPHEAGKIARLAEATARLAEQQARLWGLYQPTATVLKMLEVSYHRSEQRISFDRSPIAALARQPVAGLTITANSETNGDGTKQLHYTDPLPLAGEIPRD
jgi:hypothetical protein